ncbi:FAD binding domain-containing protein [Infundibulicybe gibba]|nr:FAD binding domain-containing protein [Infundibulicybe gibba]
MASPTSPRVLVVGAGPSGLVAALVLVKNGVSVRIIEKDHSRHIGQRGAAIMPRSLELFSSLGLDEIEKLAIKPPTVRMYTREGDVETTKTFEMAPYIEPTSACPHMNPVLLGQENLGRIITNALAKDFCEVELGTELLSFSQHEDYVEVNLTKRGPSGEEVSDTEKFAWVIGADGARGVVRKQLELSFLGEALPQENLVVGDVIVDGLDQSFWHLLGQASTILLSLRPTEIPSLFNYIIAGPDVDHAKLAEDEVALRKCFADQTRGRQDAVVFKDVLRKSLYVPQIRMVDKFGKGRVYVTGDAGHIHSPAGGQGMNSGIQDSFNLAWKVALVEKGLAPASLLDTYTEERIPVIAEMLGVTTELLKKTFKKEHDQSAWDRTGCLLQLGVNYRWSSIVVDEQSKDYIPSGDDTNGDQKQVVQFDDVDPYGKRTDGRLRAGDRAPDACDLFDPRTGTTTRLFNIFGPTHHTVVHFSTDGLRPRIF